MRTILFLSLAVSLFADEFPKPFNTGTDVGKMPMPATEAVKKIRMPDGFKATLFASEPEVQNPIACAWDSRGRLWVAENYSYADAATGFDKNLRDRILIFEDTDNDGKADKRTVFADNLHNLTSIELGYGGVFATAAPYLLWIPDRDGDDKPDALLDKVDASTAATKSILPGTSYEILLDGWATGGVRHNFVNGLKWGPDGWLYGRHGILLTSKVGRPGTPDAERLPVNVGIWRFHPVRHLVEMVTYGGTNPWGLDWNEEGEGFFTNTVTGHLYHMIPGAHYERMYGEDANPYIYQLLPQTADHYHYDRSKSWTASRDGAANSLGGGHAHVGCMIYHGENWPAQYRGKLMTLNLHGRCINVDRLERKGSGYTAKHEPDMIFFDDPWFRGIELTYGPDGGVFVLDWSDQGECHDNDGVHRESGRIYKITYGEVKKPEWMAGTGIERKKSDSEGWTHTEVTAIGTNQILIGPSSSNLPRLISGIRTAPAEPPVAESIAAENRASGRVGVPPADARVPRESSNVETATQRGGLSANDAKPTLDDPGETPRPAGGTPTLPATRSNPKGDLKKLSDQQLISAALHAPEWASRIARRLAAERGLASPERAPDGLPSIRRTLWKYGATERQARLGGFWAAYYMGKLKGTESALEGWALLLKAGAKDEDDISTLTYWASFGSIIGSDDASVSKRAVDIALATSRSLILENTARRLTSDIATKPDRIDGLLALAGTKFDADKAASITRGISLALRGATKVSAPKNWPAFAAQATKVPALADKLRELNVIFGDGRALDEIRAIALDEKAELPTRRQAVETLISSKDAELRKVCETIVTNRDLTPVAIRGLATFDDPNAAKLAMENFGRVLPDDRAGAIGTFCSRAGFARALLDAIAAGRVARESITAYHARQLAALGDADISKLLSSVWGEIRTTPDDKKRRMESLKAALTPEVVAKADIENGRTIYTQTCAACHTLYDLGQSGANLGPNLTGSGRGDINYLLENIVDPSAVVPADYKLSTVTMKDGRVLSGFISAQNPQTMTLRTMTETQTLDRTTVAKTEASAQSLMPEGILDALQPEQIRDLFGFLMKK